MSTVLKYETAIMGYICELEDEYAFNVPNGIKKLIIEYYPKKINYIGKFLKENAGQYIKIESDQLSFDGYRAAKLDQPLPISLEYKNMSITYRWRAVCECSCEGSLDAVIFGVVSNRCTRFHAYPYSDLKDGYGIARNEFRVFYGPGYGNNEKYKGFNKDEVICIEYEVSDCNKCRLSFYNESKDNEFMFAMELPNRKDITNWYPVFSKPNSAGCIRVIPY